MTTAARRLPVIYGGHDLGPRPETREQVAAALARGLDPVFVSHRVGEGLSELWRECLTRLSDEEPRPACEKGCAHCCHQRVEVTAPEVFGIVRFARERWRPGDVVYERVLASAERHSTLSSKAHFAAQCACPFLDEDGACQIYEVRPLACRRAHSVDARVCGELAANPNLETLVPVSPALDWNTSALVIGFYEGLAHGGVAPAQYELARAVSLAWTTPDAEPRWRQGEEVLAMARTRSAAELERTLG